MTLHRKDGEPMTKAQDSGDVERAQVHNRLFVLKRGGVLLTAP
jgi:hypothetical protein